MTRRFRVEAWAAVAAGLTTQPDWQTFFHAPRALERDFIADASGVPAALRRRLGPLGRAALAVANAVRPATPCPMVFVSRHGELKLTADLLAQLAAEGGVSPMGFSLSVHNAIPGIYSIAHADRVATTCLAANRDLAECGVVEALGWLASGCERVMLVCAEDAVPAPYEGDGTESAYRHAWAIVMRTTEGEGFSLEPREATATASELPADLRALAFLVGQATPDADALDTGRFHWRRHA